MKIRYSTVDITNNEDKLDFIRSLIKSLKANDFDVTEGEYNTLLIKYEMKDIMTEI